MSDFFTYNDHEIAERRLKRRATRIMQLKITLGLIALIVIFIMLVPTVSCLWVIVFLLGVISIPMGIEHYYDAPERLPSNAQTEEEMRWLFGEEWQANADAKQYAFAQERIRQRAVRRWTFAGHLLVFIPAEVLLLQGFHLTNSTDSAVWLVIMVGWAFLVFLHWRYVFPSNKRLEKRETQYGNYLRGELERMQPEQKAKLKRGVYYMVGDDGELVEVEDEDNEAEKPKTFADRHD